MIMNKKKNQIAGKRGLSVGGDANRGSVFVVGVPANHRYVVSDLTCNNKNIK